MKKILIRLAMSLLLSLVSFSVRADEVILHGFLFSQHLQGRGDFNQSHGLLGVEYKKYFFETFINSNYERTFYIGKWERDAFHGDAKYGLSSGYNYGVIKGYADIRDGKPFPMFFFTHSYKFENGFGLDISWIPIGKVDLHNTEIVIGIQANYTFGG